MSRIGNKGEPVTPRPESSRGALPCKRSPRRLGSRRHSFEMRIGIAFDLKDDDVAQPPAPGLPDDWQEEFDSPETVAAIAAALRAHGHQVVELGDGRPFVEKLLADPPDLVFNIAEGRGVSRSREARVPAVRG